MITAKTFMVEPEQRFVLRGVSWEFYLECYEELIRIGSRTRLTYNEGMLEFMVTKSPHEFYKKMLAKLVEMMIFETRRPVSSGGSMTIQRSDLEKGFEPDECWWLANEEKVRGKEEFDFFSDPPPDLAVEVEISSSLANRIEIYSAIKVPEIWRFDGNVLRFCVLREDGQYVDQQTSLSFPSLLPENLTPFLNFKDARDETTRLHEFVEWFRKTRK